MIENQYFLYQLFLNEKNKWVKKKFSQTLMNKVKNLFAV